jgi:hypothetical protein
MKVMVAAYPPRKRRTRQHVIADQSVHHVLGLILDAGFTAEPQVRDYGYDLSMKTYDADGYIEPGLVFFQIKATERLRETDGEYFFDLDIRDYNLWRAEQIPIVLVLFDASHRRAYWLDVKQYFMEDETRRPTKGARWVRARIPKKQRLTRRTIVALRLRKLPPIDFAKEHTRGIQN